MDHIVNIHVSQISRFVAKIILSGLARMAGIPDSSWFTPNVSESTQNIKPKVQNFGLDAGKCPISSAVASLPASWYLLVFWVGPRCSGGNPH